MKDLLAKDKAEVVLNLDMTTENNYNVIIKLR
jgi:hypothetical protein